MTRRQYFGMRVSDCGFAKYLRSALVVVLLLLAASYLLPSAFGQSTSATLSGTVEDANGAVVPGTTLTATNVATTLRRQAVTNAEGSFTLPLLPPGTYMLRAEHDGFAPVQVENVILNVGDLKALRIHLKVGNISEMVQIEGDAPLINESPAVSTVVDRKVVENMPLNGRSFQTLIILAPGVTQVPGDAGQFSVNGQRADANYFTVDGASANIGGSFASTLGQTAGGQIPAANALGGTNSLVSVDALQEFRIQTSSFAPEFGRTPGGQVSLLTRSGTNQFHGLLFDYLRNDVLDANNWFANRAGQPKPQDRQNDFGGTFSGPVLLPRFGEGGRQPAYNGHNRTFFFFSYEGLRLRQPLTAVSNVPSTNSANPALNRQSAPASTRQLLNAFPLPNGPDLGNGTAQFTASYSNPSTLDAYSIRVDHALTPKSNLFARYNYSPSESDPRTTFMLSTVNKVLTTLHTFTLGVTSSITSHIDNDFRANISSNTTGSIFYLDNFGGAVPVADGAVFPSGVTSANGFLLALGGGLQLQFGKNAINKQRQLNFVDNLSVLSGDHQLKFGVDYRRLTPVAGPRPYLQSLNFSAISGATGWLSGKTSSATITTTAEVALLQNNYSVYGQDTWKITPRLTATYGLRWDVNPAITGQNSATQPPAVQGINSLATIALAPVGTPIFATTWGNIAPRVGLAYQLRQSAGWETMVRGGFGVFYDLGTGSLGLLAAGYPFGATNALGSVVLPLTAQQAAPPALSTALPTNRSLFVADPHLALPRTYQWNVAIEQSLGSRQTISAAYVGAIGRKLLRVDALSAPNPSFTAIVDLTRNLGASDYHAFQLQFQRRLSRGFQALASYTWSHSLDNASTDNVVTSITPTTIVNANADRGDSDFDVRHSLTASITYDIPFPKTNKIAHAVFGDWSLDNLVTARTAFPVNILGTFFTISGAQYSSRVNIIPGIPLYLFGPQDAGGKALNNTPNQGGTGCKGPYCPVSAGQQGNMRRNSLRGFGAWQTNFAVRRQFHFTEHTGLQLRAEFFNLFNHPNFGNPTNSFATATFGLSTTTLATFLGTGGATGTQNPLYQLGGPRSIQLAVRITF